MLKDGETTEPYDPDRSSFTRGMALGHWMRLGHVLTGYYVITEGIGTLIRTCCNGNNDTGGSK